LKNSRSIDIAFFLPNMEGAAAERIMGNLTNSLSSRGMTVDFVLGKAEGPNLKKLNRNVNVVDLRNSNVFGWLRPVMQYLKTTKPRIVFSGLHHRNRNCTMGKNANLGFPLKLLSAFTVE